MMTLLAALLAQLSLAQVPAYSLAAGSRLWIEGDSNVHAWSCQATKLETSIQLDPAAPEVARSVTVAVPLAGIDCGHGGMNDRLRDALHAKEHPAITFKLLAAQRVPGEGLKLQTRGELTINGVTRVVSMPAQGEIAADGSIHATGSLRTLMTQFKVDPPGALFLKTKDAVTVKFDLRVVPNAAHASL